LNKPSPFLVADLFCGAGGSSTGAERAVRAIGREMTFVCVNHWPVAIETHKKNHPSARHYVEDVTVADPLKIVPEGYLDLLMASPECRFYSRARGGRPVHDQGRMNPWAIHRWLTSLDVRCLLVENVQEFIDWGPLLEDGTPDPKKKGQYFQSWFTAIRKLGYKPQWRYLNAADYGDATTRVRFFMIARKDNKPVRWPEASHSPTGDSDMLGQRPKWRAAREIIDWQNPGRSLLDDPRYLKRPLSSKTLKRIARGLQKFGGQLAPLYIQLLGLEPEGEASGDAAPFILNRHGDNGGNRAHDINNPVPTTDTRGSGYIVNPTVEPFVMGKQSNPSYRSVDEPIPTVLTGCPPMLIEPVAKPFILGQHSGSAPRDTNNPIPTIMTDGAISLVEPTMIKYYSNGWDGDVSSVDSPVPTVTTKARLGLVTPTAKPFIVQNRIRPDGDRVYEIEKPLLTVTGHGAGALVNPVLVEVNHSGCPSSRNSHLLTGSGWLFTATCRAIASVVGVMEKIEDGPIN